MSPVNVLLIAIWELFVRYGGLSNLVVSGPWEVARTLTSETDILWDATWVTAREALLGLAAACVFGIALGVVLHLSPFLRDATLPVVVASQAVPTVVLAPLLVIAFAGQYQSANAMCFRCSALATGRSCDGCFGSRTPKSSCREMDRERSASSLECLPLTGTSHPRKTARALTPKS